MKKFDHRAKKRDTAPASPDEDTPPENKHKWPNLEEYKLYGKLTVIQVGSHGKF